VLVVHKSGLISRVVTQPTRVIPADTDPWWPPTGIV
jgi:hypothetical protein